MTTTSVQYSSDQVKYFKNQNAIQITSRASNEEAARTTWEKEGYILPQIGKIDIQYPERTIQRKGNLTAGNGFYDVVVVEKGQEMRLVYYGPREYVLPHLHNEKEIFHITTGSTHVWLWNEFKSKWDYFFKQTHDVIEIEAGTIHCLIAGDDGLSMYVPRNDNTRSVEWRAEVKLPEPFADAILCEGRVDTL